MAHIDEGDVLWIHPEQWSRSGHPDGFPLRVVGLLGRDELDPRAGWIRGVALDRVTGLPMQEIIIKVPDDQPRAQAAPTGPTDVDSPAPQLPGSDPGRAFLVVGNRRYRRVH